MDKELLKQRVNAAIDEAAAKIKDLADRIYAEPEMGYKEVKTAAKVAAFMKDEFFENGYKINDLKRDIYLCCPKFNQIDGNIFKVKTRNAFIANPILFQTESLLEKIDMEKLETDDNYLKFVSKIKTGKPNQNQVESKPIIKKNQKMFLFFR